MLDAADFDAVRAAGRTTSLRAAGTWLALSAAWRSSMHGSARLGLTISRKMARRAAARALVKRIVRESFRHAAAELQRHASAAGVGVDVAVRLRAPVPRAGDPLRLALAVWRRELRRDADRLFALVCARIAALPAHA
jgi:ribonuclease P protein component